MFINTQMIDITYGSPTDCSDDSCRDTFFGNAVLCDFRGALEKHLHVLTQYGVCVLEYYNDYIHTTLMPTCESVLQAQLSAGIGHRGHLHYCKPLLTPKQPQPKH